MKHKVIVFSDYACPFCYIGKGILDELKKEFDIQDDWLPYELHPEVPLEGRKVSDFAGVSAKEIFADMNKAGHQYGISFAGADLMCNSHKALLATEYAKEKGKLHEFHEKVFYAYFAKGKNIGDIGILANIARTVGLDEDEMIKKIEAGTHLHKLEEAKSLAPKYDINVTPTFIIDDKHVIVGAQPIASFRKALSICQ